MVPFGYGYGYGYVLTLQTPTPLQRLRYVTSVRAVTHAFNI